MPLRSSTEYFRSVDPLPPPVEPPDLRSAARDLTWEVDTTFCAGHWASVEASASCSFWSTVSEYLALMPICSAAY